jgi:UDP-N-acetylmuramate dehydrogenase
LKVFRVQRRDHFNLASYTWFKVGGLADTLVIPFGLEDLSELIGKKDGTSITVLGMGSNVIIHDEGIKGTVIKLGKGFAEVSFDGTYIKVGCAMPNHQLVKFLQAKGLSGLEFLYGIPGSVGGAIAMNAGCYGSEVANALVSVEAVNLDDGKVYDLKKQDLRLEYRKNALADKFIFTSASFMLNYEEPAVIKARLDDISLKKSMTQPGHEKTGGSTFKNPEGYKAWELIDASGFRGYCHGGAKVSEKHPNFLINNSGATAQDLKSLGDMIIEKVWRDSGIQLEWEIKHLGWP